MKGNKEVIYHSRDYAITKESENFYGVYEYYLYGPKYISGEPLITSGKSFSSALKKLKLLQSGFNRARSEYTDY